MNIFFTADTHFYHKNILSYSNRPFNSVEEMNEKLIENWNETVGRKDIIYHLGDFAITNKRKDIEDILSRLQGRIFHIRGNHDKLSNFDRFEWAGDYKYIRGSQFKIALFHFPIYSWNGMHRGNIHLHGHSHGSLKWNPLTPKPRRFDVGVDCFNYKPVSLEEIEKLAREATEYNLASFGFKYTAVDHHRED